MTLVPLHRWPRSPKAAIAIQKRLAPRVCLRAVGGEARLIGGVDAAFSSDGTRVLAGVVVWDRHSGHAVEQRVAWRPCRFPYVPGLLSFRETPAILAALRKLTLEPDVFLCDAQGLAHPRRFGLACHLGLWLNKPTIGCAKTRLCGRYEEPGRRRGSAAPLLLGGRQVGVVLRTREAVKPVFVSPGHLCDLAGAVDLCLSAATRFRLPEPTRLAHQLVSASRRRSTC